MAKVKTVYAIGVGPGDSQLLTLKAVAVLQKVKTVFIPQSSQEKPSLAWQTVQPFLRGQKVKKLSFPMTKDKKTLKANWEKAAQEILANLKKETAVAFVTLGDPSLYSTFIYLEQALQAQAKKTTINFNVEVIPGISSFQQAAATLKLPLLSGDESMAVISGANFALAESLLEHCQTVVIMKAAQYVKEILELVSKLNCQAYLVKKLGLAGEEVINLKKESLSAGPHYLSLVVIKNKS